MNPLDVVNATNGALELECADFEVLTEGGPHVTLYYFADGSSIDVTVAQHLGPES